jgi:hypothetical protein
LIPGYEDQEVFWKLNRLLIDDDCYILLVFCRSNEAA